MSELIETRCIHGDLSDSLRDSNRAVSFPIYQTATFSHIKTGHNENGFDYTRESNPTRQRVEEIVASLEGAADAAAFSSGMAAVSACLNLFSPGDHIIFSEDLYGGVVRLNNLISSKNKLEITYIDTTDIDNIKSAVKPNTKALYIETPSNPMMKITDLRLCADIAKENNLLLIVDNTFLSPYFQNPLSLGADIVIHSGSKFLSGHNDTIAGFICVKDRGISEKLRLISKTVGGTLAPFDSWLVIRGIKTLAVRMERQQENALKLVDWLQSRPEVTEVFYPGIKTHPGYDINAAQARGTGSMISFHVNSEETALGILKNVKLVTFAESLGGTETLITYPMLQTHPDVPEEMRNHLGITDTLLRISVGLENIADITADLEQAFER